MKKKSLKLFALLAALILALGLAWTANGLVGNPISKYLAAKGAEKYLSEHFPGTDYYIEETSYNFKNGDYCAKVKSPSSIDTYFTISMDMAGRFCWHSFDDVEEKFNTAIRLDAEYRDLTDKAFESPSFPYPLNIAYGSLEIYSKEQICDPDDIEVPDYSLAQENLELDKLYDIRQLGAQAGHLVIYMESDTVTAEKAAETMLDIKNYMDDAGIPFYAMEFHLQEPLPEDGTLQYESIDILNFLYEDLHKENLVDRIKRADEEAKAFYGIG